MTVNSTLLRYVRYDEGVARGTTPLAGVGGDSSCKFKGRPCLSGVFDVHMVCLHRPRARAARDFETRANSIGQKGIVKTTSSSTPRGPKVPGNTFFTRTRHIIILYLSPPRFRKQPSATGGDDIYYSREQRAQCRTASMYT